MTGIRSSFDNSTQFAINSFVDRSVAEIPDDTPYKAKAAARMHKGLDLQGATNDTDPADKVWNDCEASANHISQIQFDEERAVQLRNLVCNATESQEAVANGIVTLWIANPNQQISPAQKALARGLLGLDGKECVAIKNFDNYTMVILRSTANATPAATPTILPPSMLSPNTTAPAPSPNAAAPSATQLQ